MGDKSSIYEILADHNFFFEDRVELRTFLFCFFFQVLLQLTEAALGRISSCGVGDLSVWDELLAKSFRFSCVCTRVEVELRVLALVLVLEGKIIIPRLVTTSCIRHLTIS